MNIFKLLQPLLKLIVLILLFGAISCSPYFLPPKVDTRTEIQYSYKFDKHFKRSKWQKKKQKTGYEHYDKKGRLIEEGEYGEIWHFRNVKKNADSSINVITGHGRNYKNLNTVHFFSFDSSDKKVQDELWKYRDNKKSRLIYKTIFEYNKNGKLIKETEFDENNKVSRLQDYSNEYSNQTVSKDSVFKFSYEGIVRVNGNSLDTMIADSTGRPTEKIHYYKDKFLYREVFRYGQWGEIVTELRYDNKPDSLWCITEWQYDIINKNLTRKFWKVIGSNTETKDLYVYNRKKLLVKVLHYSGEELRGFTKYKYQLYK